MNAVWIVIMLASIATLIFVNPGAVLSGMITGAHSSVALALNLIALYGIWLGLFEIIEKTGLSGKLSKLLSPIIRFLFKGESRECEKYVAMNISANLLGLGNAATPMGINAVGEMKPNQKNAKKASLNMIMLVVLSATSLQILPSTVIGMRAAAGSANAADFLLPCIAATVTSTVIGVLLVKIIGKFIKE